MPVIFTTEVDGADLSQERDSSKDKASVPFMASGYADLYAAWAAVNTAAPGAVGPLIKDSIKIKNNTQDIWEGTVSYVSPEKQKKNPDIGEIEWEVDDTGGTQHITQGLAATKIFHAPGWNPMEFQRAIDVSRTKSGWQVKGTDIIVPKGQITATTSFAPGDIDLAWYNKTKKLVGKTNKAKFKIWEAGEFKFLGRRIKAKGRDKITVVFSFLEAENIVAADDVKIGGDAAGNGAIGPIEMTGHQYIWVYYVQEEDNNQVLMKPKQVCIETVCREGDFGDLGLGN